MWLVIAVASVLAACSFSYSSGVSARSGPATIGVAEDFVLADCGGPHTGPTIMDFDASLWRPVGADPAELASVSPDGEMIDTGTVTLVSAERAEYRSDRGPVYSFERQAGTLTFEGCVPRAHLRDEG
jgi:hypothetical protein